MNGTTNSSRGIGAYRTTSLLTTGAMALLTATAQAQATQTATNSSNAQRNTMSAAPRSQASVPAGILAPNRSTTTNGASASIRGGSNQSAVRVGGSTNGVAANNNANIINSGSASSNGSGITSGNALSFFGYPDFGGFGAYAAQPFGGGYGGGFSGGTLSGGNITVVGSSYLGGFATLGPGGTYSFGQTGGYTPVGDPNSPAYNPNANDPRLASPGVGSLNGRSIQDTAPRPEKPSLAQSLIVRRGRGFDLSIGWRGDPELISGLTVTLLNRYHLPVSQQTAESGTQAYFPANKDTFAARYYRVDVQYADGAVASLTASLQK